MWGSTYLNMKRVFFIVVKMIKRGVSIINASVKVRLKSIVKITIE